MKKILLTAVVFFICFSFKIFASTPVSRTLYGDKGFVVEKLVTYFTNNPNPVTSYSSTLGIVGSIHVGKSRTDHYDGNIDYTYQYANGFVEYDLTKDGAGLQVTSATFKVKLYNAEGQSPSLIFEVVRLSNDMESYDAQNQYSIIKTASTLQSKSYTQELTVDVTSLVNSASSSGKIIFGIRPQTEDQTQDAVYYAELSYTGTVPGPFNFTVDNNFTDNSGNGTHGSVIIDNQNITVPSSGYTVSRNSGQSISLQAVSPQTDNQNYQRVWNTSSNGQKSWWANNLGFKTNNQSYTFIWQTI